MSELYKADASNFTREQLVELINHQTNLHLEGKAILIIAKGKIEELEHKLELAVKALEEIERFQVLTSQDIALPMEIARETLEKLK